MFATPVVEKVLSSIIYTLRKVKSHQTLVELHWCRILTKANTGSISYCIKPTVIYTCLFCYLDALWYC